MAFSDESDGFEEGERRRLEVGGSEERERVRKGEGVERRKEERNRIKI